MAERMFSPGDADDILGKAEQHDAYGVIGVSHVSGQKDLFMVDYPQEHYVVLRIKKAETRRNLSNTNVFGKAEIIEVAMSEVQWARMIAAPNRNDGVPCTLSRYTDPLTKEYKTPKLEGQHAASVETFSAEVRAAGSKVAGRVQEAQSILTSILAGGAPRKADLQKLKEALYFANQGLESSLGFVVGQAEEAIHKSAESAKAEVEAHVDFVMTKLGERALGERLQDAVRLGHQPADVGRLIAGALSDRPDDEVI